MSVLTLPEAKLHLNITGTASDVELQATIDAAEAVLARRVGPLAATSVTERVSGGTDTLVLTTTPVISLTSVTPVGGAALTVGDLDGTNGLVSYSGSGWFGASSYVVVYQAGRATLPVDLLQAVKEMVRHLWGSQRGQSAVPGFGADEDKAVTPAYLFPYRVLELISPYLAAGV